MAVDSSLLDLHLLVETQLSIPGENADVLCLWISLFSTEPSPLWYTILWILASLVTQTQNTVFLPKQHN